MARKKWIIGSLITVVVVGAIGAKVATGGNKGVEVRIEPVARRNLVATVTASGKIKPKTKVDISADITGRIIELPVVEGQRVRKGDLLLRIDPSTFEASVARAEALLASAQAAEIQSNANRDQAERALARYKELRSQSPTLVSDEQLEQAQTSYDAAAAVAKEVAPLTAKGDPWRYSAREITALAALKEGDRAKAVSLFTALSSAADAPQGLRARAAEMVAIEKTKTEKTKTAG